MFSYRRKIRAACETTIWGAADSPPDAHRGCSATLCVQVEEIGDDVTLLIFERSWFFWVRRRCLRLRSGDVYALDLDRVLSVRAATAKTGDSSVNCSILSSARG